MARDRLLTWFTDLRKRLMNLRKVVYFQIGDVCRLVYLREKKLQAKPDISA